MRKFFPIIFLFLITNINSIFALQIKNVNYSASNNNDRWIEIYNDGSDITDFTLSDYKILDSKDSTKHSINPLKGDNSFPSGSTAFISSSNNLPTEVNKVFKSSYSLDKVNGFISIINSDNSASYSCFNFGNISCPNSLHIDNNLSTSTNSNSDSLVDSTSTPDNTSTSSSSSDSNKNIVYVYLSNNQNKYGDIQVLLPDTRIVPAGADADYTVKVIDSGKNVITGLDFNWSFGDGGTKIGKDVSYHYVYPGDYTLVATADGYTSGGQARMNVTVIDPKIEIIKVGDGQKENFIDIKNNTDYDLFLSDFYLELDGKYYELPKNFLIAKNKVVHISGEALGFKLPASNVSLLYPNKNILISYIKDFTNTILASTTVNTIFSSSSLDIAIPSSSLPLINKDEPITLDKKENNISFTRNIIKDDLPILENNTKHDFSLKRLVLQDDEDENIENESQKVDKVPENDDNVDIGIVKWLKSLLY